MSKPGDYSTLDSDGGVRRLRRSVPGDYSTLRADGSLESSLGDLSDDGEFWAGGGPTEGKVGVWAAIKINGLWFPGQTSLGSPGVIPVYIDDGEKAYKEDKQSVRGKHGHRQVYNGYIAARFVVRCRITTSVQWSAFKAYLPQIDPEVRSQAFAASSAASASASKKVQAAQAQLAAATARFGELDLAISAKVANPDIQGPPKLAPGRELPLAYLQSQRDAAQKKLDAAKAAVSGAKAATRAGAEKSIFRIEHPMLNAYRITTVDIIKVGFPREADGRMVRDVPILMQQITQQKDVGSHVAAPAGKVPEFAGDVRFTVDGQISAEPRRP